MFEYVTEKKGYDKEQIKSRVLTAVATMIAAAGVFAAIYYAAGSG